MPFRPSLGRSHPSTRPSTPNKPSLPPPPVERRTSSTGPVNALTSTFTRTLKHDVGLTDILSGQTCSPIGFKDLEAYLAHKEFSLENLLFLVWFQSYQRRFLALPAHVQARAVRPEAGVSDQWGNGKRRGWERVMGLAVDAGVIEEDERAVGGNKMKREGSASRAIGEKDATEYAVELGGEGEVEVRRVGFQKCAWTQDGLSCTYNPDATESSLPSSSTGSSAYSTATLSEKDRAHELHCSNVKHSHSTSTALHLTTSCAVDDDDEGQMPFREECRRAYATFLRRGAVKELNLEDKVRERVKNQLAVSTHPDCWLAAYESTFALVETHSLNQFLNFAQANIGTPKRFFWYLVGAIDLFLSVLILLVTIFLLPSRPFAWRCIRLVSVLFACFGAGQVYSASKGFCSQVFGRASRQAHPWEMEDLEEDEEIAIGGVGGGVGFSDSASSTTTTNKSPPAIMVSAYDDSRHRFPDDLAPSPTSTQFSVTGDPPKKATVEHVEDRLSPTPLAGPHPTPAPAASSPPPPRPAKSTRRPLTPRTDADFNVVLVPACLLPTTDSDTTPVSLSRSSSAISLGLSGGPAPHPITIHPLRISHSASSRSTDPIQTPGLYTWDDPSPPAYSRTKRFPIFGPEVVVEDPRVLALHRRVVTQIFVVGLAWAAVWTGICLGVPGP